MNMSFQKTFYVIATVIALFVVLSFARVILIPLGLAFLIAFILYPVTKKLEYWGLNEMLGAFLSILLFIAIIGGSLLPFGAQNLIEACAVGRPVVVGPSTYNFAEAAQMAIEAGAALGVADAAGAVAAARELLRDPARARNMGQAGIDFTREHRGATAKVVGLIKFGD